MGRLGLPLAPRAGHGRGGPQGEGLVLRLGDGRTFTVTVDDAEAGVRFIREQLQLPAAGAATGA